MVKKCENIQQLRTEFRNIKGVISGDTRFAAQAILFISERMDKFLRNTQKEKREPTAYQLFVGEKMRRGATIQEAAKAWRKRE